MPIRRGSHGARFTVAILAALALAGCGKTNQCKTGTVFVTVTFGGDALRAKNVQVVTTTDGGTAHQAMTLVSHTPQSATGTIEIDFPHGYPQGKSLEVTLTALDDGGQPIASGSNNTGPLQAGCATLQIGIGGTDGGVGSGTGGSGGRSTTGAGGGAGHPGAGASGTGGSGGAPGVGGSSGAGGSAGSGGAGGHSGASGGSTGAGGLGATGGAGGGAGRVGTGGAPATGGMPGTGGIISTGGVIGSGGARATGGVPGTGGVTSTGGTPATGGVPGTGGVISTGGAPATGGTTGTGGSTPVASTPCDVLGLAGNPCVAAHSTVRVVYGGYTGPLYQVCKGSYLPGPGSCAGTTKEIGSIAGGYADAASQDAFCAGATCTISIIYDQSPMKNDLQPAPGGGAKATADNPAVATALPATLNGHAVYGVLLKANIGYRAGCTTCAVTTAKGTATGDQPETEYMVTSQNNLINGCCFDYGNAETDAHDDGNGSMEAVYFGGGVVWGTGTPGGHNNGPWVMADLENGLFAGWENGSDQAISTNTALKLDFVSAVVVGDVAAQNAGKGRFALYGGDATAGTVKTMYDGIRPAKTGYVPMKKQGSIVLGISGDNSDSGGGEWFEGVMASGAATLATVNALQANIVAAGYGK